MGRQAGLSWFAAIVLGLTLLHGLLAGLLPLSGDEAYYWDCSRHLDWSYYDQPPLVIWLMTVTRALLGETRLAVRAPSILASLVLALCLLPLARSLGGDARHAGIAYLLMHGMPILFLGSFYASTDMVMTAAYVGAAWAAVAIAQGSRRAWWGFAVAIGLGFLAKHPVVLVLPALIPALIRPATRRQLRTAAPYLAALLAALLTTPVWLWGARHDWDNLAFQLVDRHQRSGLDWQYLAELVAANLLLATPFLITGMLIAAVKGWRRQEPGWQALVIAAAAPLLFFAMVALVTRVGPHWTGPGLVLAVLALALVRFRGWRLLAAAGMVLGLSLSAAVVVVAHQPESLLGLSWSYQGRPHRISTGKVAAAIGNDEIVAAVTAARAEGELVASESYSKIHLLAFKSRGQLPVRLAHVKPGKHGLASLYWYPAEELRGRDVLFVTEKQQVDERLRQIFAEVEEESPVTVERNGQVIRTVRLLRCQDLRHPEGVFTRIGR
jgi:4-amino-4-deoxy-L-arabinose transferase-like glycosyltransferase